MLAMVWIRAVMIQGGVLLQETCFYYMGSRNRDKVVTSPADYSSAECNLFARRDVESLGRWAADNAKHKIQTLVFILLSVLVNIRNYSLFSLSRYFVSSLPKMVSTRSVHFPASHRLSSALKSPQP